MALAAVGGLIPYPAPPPGVTGAITLSSTTFVINAASEKIALLFRAPKAGNIRKLNFRTGTVATGDTVDLRLETISSGVPSGTLAGVNGNASHAIANGDDNVWITGTAFTADVTVTLGQPLAAVIVNGGGGGDIQIAHFADASQTNFPYGALFEASWVRHATMPVIVPEYSDGTYAYIHGLWAPSAVGNTNTNTGTTPDEIGNQITIPFACRVAGAWIWHIAASTADFDLVLYEGAGVTPTEVARTSVDADEQQAAASSGGPNWFLFEETVEFSAGDVVRIVCLPTTVNNVQMQHVDVNAAGLMAMCPAGTAAYHTQRTNAGNFSETTTRRQMIGLLLDQLDDGAGVGGGSTFPVIGGGGPVL
jgi:hypothetical protein